jgi:CDGSH iron-sulfur domain-containing protein 3
MEPTIAQKEPIKVEVEAGKTVWWCACGLSANQPFCDGSHRGSGFAPTAYTPASDGQVFFCGCKRSATAPLCDGTHRRL